ncbi:DUF4906 domain-containing protein [Dysgonomonas sp. GY75]|nr:DUF4906 domain-containing protein [Dysgonomonas sp. GY75]
MYKHISIPLLWLGVLFLFMLACSSCRNEEPYDLKGSSKQVTISLTVPGGTQTYAMPADEATVNTIDVLCFQTDPSNPTDVDKGTFLYRATVGHRAGDNSFTVILSELDVSPAVNQTLVVLANCRTEVETLLGSISTGTPKASVISSLLLSQPTFFDASVMTGIPMWGEITNQAVTSGYSPGPLNVTLTRMLARINITNAETDFNLQEAYLYNPRQKGSVIPDNWTGTDVTTVTTVTGAQMAQGTKFGPFTTTTEQITDKIYTFEADNITQAGVSLLDATCLVVGGLYNGSVTKSYYRIDLKDYASGVFYDVKRNYSYNVTINDIDTEGPDNPDDAYKGKAIIKATVTAWNDRNADVTGGQNHLRVSAGIFDFTSLANTATLSVYTDYPGGWTVDKIVDGAGADASSWLSTDVRSGATNATTSVSVSVADYNGAARKGFIHIIAGNLTYKVTVNQDAYQAKWAGSNIYWDGTSLTFDDVSTSGPSPHETYQGVYFKWGSLWGISPQGNWSDNSTVVYVPDGNGYTSDIASSWSSVPYWVRGGLISDPDEHYITDVVHTAANIANGYGDICKYLTELNGGTLHGRRWRLPTANDFKPGDSSLNSISPSDNTEYVWSSWSSSASGAMSPDGIDLIPNGVRKSLALGQPWFPASGYRYATNGSIGYYGDAGDYWTSSAGFTNTSGALFRVRENFININIDLNPDFGLSVRCVAY